jgi:hypothetical protein
MYVENFLIRFFKEKDIDVGKFGPLIAPFGRNAKSHLCTCSHTVSQPGNEKPTRLPYVSWYNKPKRGKIYQMTTK